MMSYTRQLALIVLLNGTKLLHDLRRSFEFDIGKVSLKTNKLTILQNYSTIEQEHS